MIRTFGGATGLTNQPQGLDVGLGGGSNIKSIQSGVTNWNDTTTTKDITISPVSIATSGTVAIVRITIMPPNQNAESVVASGVLLNATTIRLTRTTGLAIATNFIMWEVIEFLNVKSKQTGTTLLNNGTITNIPISSVNVQKTMPFISIRDSALSTDSTRFSIAYRIQDSSTLVALSFSGTCTAYWQVIEFN